MKRSDDFKARALKALKGRWGTAVLAALIATFLGALVYSGPELEIDYNEFDIQLNLNAARRQTTLFEISNVSDGVFNTIILCLLLGAVILILFRIIIGGSVDTGYKRFNLDMMEEGKKPGIDTLFSYFKYWKTMAAARFLTDMYILLWTIALIVPGIMASYSYSMTNYILAENPGMKASEAIRRSKEMMKGNRGRLFCLHLSFIGWEFLSILTMGVGNLWLVPYMRAADTAFYRDLTGRDKHIKAIEDTQE